MVSFFSNLISSITEQGRKLVEIGKAEVGLLETDPIKIAQELISEKGEASGTARAANLISAYHNLDAEGRLSFFTSLARDFGPDFEALDAAIKNYQSSPGQDSAMGLYAAAESRRQELIRRLNRAGGGTSHLVKMREDLLKAIKAHKELKSVDRDFEHLLTSWFNRGFLVLERISWQTPANILEKIIRYEAVHEIQSWEDLRRRIDPPDRRCYAFFHPALVDEPLIFVEVALVNGIPNAIAPILQQEREAMEDAQADTAVFYSISNCQQGLKGISFGNFLIKQVVQTLKQDVPHLKKFVTLSPVPGFTRWLNMELGQEKSSVLTDEDRAALEPLQKNNWDLANDSMDAHEELMCGLAATYFMSAKDRYGKPFDPVARFHLGNGARLEQINWRGDLSQKAQDQAAHFMVNYLYKLDDIESNHEAYAKHNEIAVSKKVKHMAREVITTDVVSVSK